MWGEMKMVLTNSFTILLNVDLLAIEHYIFSVDLCHTIFNKLYNFFFAIKTLALLVFGSLRRRKYVLSSPSGGHLRY